MDGRRSTLSENFEKFIILDSHFQLSIIYEIISRRLFLDSIEINLIELYFDYTEVWYILRFR